MGFWDETSAVPLGNGRYQATITTGWESRVGAHGGYLAAVALDAMCKSAEDNQLPRSLSVHFATPAARGELVAHTLVEKSGHRASTNAARLIQHDRTVLISACTLAHENAFDAPAYIECTPPHVPNPADCDILRPEEGITPPFFGKLIHRPAVGAAPFSGARHSRTACWIRPAQCTGRAGVRSQGCTLLTVLADAWIPAAYLRMTEPTALATLSMDVHFRNDVSDPTAYHLVVANSALSRSGLADQNITIWDQDKHLLAQARLLCALIRTTTPLWQGLLTQPAHR